MVDEKIEVKGQPPDAINGPSQRLNTSSGIFGNKDLARWRGVIFLFSTIYCNIDFSVQRLKSAVAVGHPLD
jgi:hypothetical protein